LFYCAIRTSDGFAFGHHALVECAGTLQTSVRSGGGEMKIEDIEKVNHLIGELNGMKQLIAHAENADPEEYELFIKLPGDASIRMSGEGAASTHYQGYAVSPEFLTRLRRLAVEELDARRHSIIAELAALGVEAEA